MNILGVSGKEPPEVLKATYRKKSLESHPDRGGTLEKMKLVNEAYDILTGKVQPAPDYDYRRQQQPPRSKPRPDPRTTNKDYWKQKWDQSDAGKAKEDARAKAEQAKRERERAYEEARAKAEEAAQAANKKYREEAENRAPKKPAPAGGRHVPKDVVERARVRMYDAFDRAPGDNDNKFNKMLVALRTRIKATKEPAKLEGILEMLRQETEEHQYMGRWNPQQLSLLKRIREDLIQHGMKVASVCERYMATTAHN
jgi:curved DNA-binding protein CbpA